MCKSYRLVNNTGSGSIMEHYHCHIISSAAGNNLPRIAVNIPVEIGKLKDSGDISPEAAGKLLAAVMQRRG